MSPFFRLVCDFEVLTPMFLGGADSREAELRAPSIKGAMRFWYRALDPRFKDREPLHFGEGGGDAGQSHLIVRCRPGDGAQNRMTWAEITKGIPRDTPNGLVYLGYPFGMGANQQRDAIPPGTRFTIEVSCHRASPREAEHGSTTLRAALASVWALGHFGALGSRARRGFGAIMLTRWRLEDRDGKALSDTADLQRLPLLHRESDAVAWRNGAWQGINTLRSWFKTFGVGTSRPHHPCFGSNADLVLWSKHPRGSWRDALRTLGEELRNARQRKPPDYGLVKAHIQSVAHNADSGRIQQSPARATFGLPLTFRYRSLPRGQEAMFSPATGNRHGSLLFLRPVLVKDSLLGLFLRLDGDVPGIDPPARVRGAGRLRPATTNAMDDFMRDMKNKAGQ